MKKGLPKVSKSLQVHTVAIPGDLGAILREARLAAGLTQEQTADLCNVGRKFILALENGSPGLSLDKVLLVLRRFGFTLFVAPRRVS